MPYTLIRKLEKSAGAGMPIQMCTFLCFQSVIIVWGHLTKVRGSVEGKKVRERLGVGMLGAHLSCRDCCIQQKPFHLKEMGFTGNLHEVELKINDSVYNFTKLDEIFESNPNIEGTVIFNSTCYILGNYLKARAMQSVKLVGYDLIERNTQLLSEGVITALVAQRPERQGYEGIKSLCNHLLFKQHSEKVNLMPIDILLKENLKYYLNNKL